MQFEIDQQSLSDLSIFGESIDGFSLLSLLKQTQTAGGYNKLAQLMMSPSNDLNLLVSRRDAIRFFYSNALELSLNFSDMELISHYLYNGGLLLRKNYLDCVVNHFKEKLYPSQAYYNIKTGLQRLLRLLKQLQEIAKRLLTAEASRLRLIGEEMGQIFESIDLIKVLSIDFEHINPIKLAWLDYHIRSDYKKYVELLLDICYEIDVYQTIAKVSASRGFSFPIYETNSQILVEVHGLFHPALSKPITNSLTLDIQHNLIFLSGCNMSGKSSLLKALGLAVYLSHLGFPVPATHMQTVVFDGLFTAINLSDDVKNGLSHYYSEVLRTKKIAELLAKQQRLFVILDELYKGTNPSDAYEASLLVINGFLNLKSSAFVVSSHLTELTGKLAEVV